MAIIAFVIFSYLELKSAIKFFDKKDKNNVNFLTALSVLLKRNIILFTFVSRETFIK